MLTRRSFLSRSAKGLAWMGLGASAGSLSWLPQDARAQSAADGETVVTFLHTNDVHSRIDPFAEGSGRNAGLAGAARRATLIDQIREDIAAAGQPEPLLLDAGDVFQGTPYFNLFKGTLDFKVMSKLGYEAMTIGNHDFDAGMEGLRDALEFADFELVSANYDFSKSILRGRVKPYIVHQRGPVRVGIFGLGVRLQGLVSDSLYTGVVHRAPLPIAADMARHLRQRENCDLIICLSHLGNNGVRNDPGDQQIAERVEGIDLIIGGHSHTFMREPTRITHGERETLVFQVGFAGINLGRVDFHMRAGKVTQARAAALPVGASASVPVGC